MCPVHRVHRCLRILEEAQKTLGLRLDRGVGAVAGVSDGPEKAGGDGLGKCIFMARQSF